MWLVQPRLSQKPADTHPSFGVLACLSSPWPLPCHPLLLQADGSGDPWCPSRRWCTGFWHLEGEITMRIKTVWETGKISWWLISKKEVSKVVPLVSSLIEIGQPLVRCHLTHSDGFNIPFLTTHTATERTKQVLFEGGEKWEKSKIQTSVATNQNHHYIIIPIWLITLCLKAGWGTCFIWSNTNDN